MARAPYPVTPAPLQKSWLERNAGWKIPLGLLLIVGAIVLFVAGILTVLSVSFRNSDVFREALLRAQRNPQVVSQIGVPLKAGWLPQGSIQVSGSTGTAHMEIPVSGPHGKGTINLDARKIAGTWRFRVLQIEIEGLPDFINLLEIGEDLGTATSRLRHVPAPEPARLQ